MGAIKMVRLKKTGDSLELFFYIPQQEPLNKIEIKATFFTELFAAQQNIIQIKASDSSPVYLKFKEGDTWQSVSFPVK